jgi:hypothetical protein
MSTANVYPHLSSHNRWAALHEPDDQEYEFMAGKAIRGLFRRTRGPHVSVYVESALGWCEITRSEGLRMLQGEDWRNARVAVKGSNIYIRRGMTSLVP